MLAETEAGGIGDLHLVMGPKVPGPAVRFRVLIDGRAPGASHGLDVDENGEGTLTEQRLYQLIRQPKPIVDRQFEIEFSVLAWRPLRSRLADRLPNVQGAASLSNRGRKVPS